MDAIRAPSPELRRENGDISDVEQTTTIAHESKYATNSDAWSNDEPISNHSVARDRVWLGLDEVLTYRPRFWWTPDLNLVSADPVLSS
jgi:hypothetical protein